jgi:hypothetical protein
VFEKYPPVGYVFSLNSVNSLVRTNQSVNAV